MVLAMACGGGSSSSVNTTPSADADALRDQVVRSMAGVNSYHAVFATGDFTFEMDFQKPNSYHSAVVADDDQTGKSTRGETIELGDTAYARKCKPDGSQCEEWDSAPRKEGRVGYGSYDPQWPVVALEIADGVSFSGGVLRGFVNQIRAILENDKRLGEAAGITPDYGQECSGGAETPIEVHDGTVVGTPESSGNKDEDCRELTYEGALEGQEPELSFLDQHPSRIDVEFDPETRLVRRFTITIIEESEQAKAQHVETHSVTFTYSDYNNVTIEAPQ
jgi:hypothetical protein